MSSKKRGFFTMKKENIAAQLFCFRDFIKTPQQVDETFGKLRSIGYRQVQLTTALPQELSVDQLKKLLAKHGLTAISAHERSEIIFDTPEKVIDKMHALGITHVAYPWPHITPADYSAAVGFARKLNELALLFKENSITLAYHNHAREFVRFGGKTMLEIIYDNAPELAAEIDTFWVHAGGGSPEKWVRRTAGRMEYLHVKDYGMAKMDDAPVMMPVRYGNLDWNAIITAAGETGVRYFIVEHDNHVTDPFDSFDKSYRYLSENFAE